MAQIKGIHSNDFWDCGFVVQINEDQFFLAQGPFQEVSLNKHHYAEYVRLNAILIKPDFWNFLHPDSKNICISKPTVSGWFTRQEFLDLVKAAAPKTVQNVLWRPDFKTEFEIQFNEMQSLIRNGTLEKAVPIGLSVGEAEEKISAAELFNHLFADTHAKGWVYGYWDQRQGFLGRTPELLFQSCPGEQNTLKTMALAGSWPYSTGVINNYQDPKVWNEHQIVIHDIKNQLQDLSCSHQSATERIELKTLSHLKTQLEFQYQNEGQILDILQELHPTAALGIYPRSSDVYKKIRQLPLQDQRKKFGAPFGVLSAGISHVVVGIRGLIWAENHLQLFAGCGITKDSQLQSEYDEVLYKMDSVKKMLGLQNS